MEVSSSTFSKFLQTKLDGRKGKDIGIHSKGQCTTDDYESESLSESDDI